MAQPTVIGQVSLWTSSDEAEEAARPSLKPPLLLLCTIRFKTSFTFFQLSELIKLKLSQGSLFGGVKEFLTCYKLYK